MTQKENLSQGFRAFGVSTFISVFVAEAVKRNLLSEGTVLEIQNMLWSQVILLVAESRLILCFWIPAFFVDL